MNNNDRFDKEATHVVCTNKRTFKLLAGGVTGGMSLLYTYIYTHISQYSMAGE